MIFPSLFINKLPITIQLSSAVSSWPIFTQLAVIIWKNSFRTLTIGWYSFSTN